MITTEAATTPPSVPPPATTPPSVPPPRVLYERSLVAAEDDNHGSSNDAAERAAAKLVAGAPTMQKKTTTSHKLPANWQELVNTTYDLPSHGGGSHASLLLVATKHPSKRSPMGTVKHAHDFHSLWLKTTFISNTQA